MAIRATAASALEAEGYSLSVLFLLFLGINLCWEVGTTAVRRPPWAAGCNGGSRARASPLSTHLPCTSLQALLAILTVLDDLWFGRRCERHPHSMHERGDTRAWRPTFPHITCMRAGAACGWHA